MLFKWDRIYTVDCIWQIIPSTNHVREKWTTNCHVHSCGNVQRCGFELNTFSSSIPQKPCPPNNQQHSKNDNFLEGCRGRISQYMLLYIHPDSITNFHIFTINLAMCFAPFLPPPQKWTSSFYCILSLSNFHSQKIFTWFALACGYLYLVIYSL